MLVKPLNAPKHLSSFSKAERREGPGDTRFLMRTANQGVSWTTPHFLMRQNVWPVDCGRPARWEAASCCYTHGPGLSQSAVRMFLRGDGRGPTANA